MKPLIKFLLYMKTKSHLVFILNPTFVNWYGGIFCCNRVYRKFETFLNVYIPVHASLCIKVLHLDYLSTRMKEK